MRSSANFIRRRLSNTSLGALIVSASALAGCAAADGGDAAHRSQAAIESVYTDLIGESCRQEIDRTDPNETPYLVCPGVAGYELIVRRVDAGRRSIDVVDSTQRAFPLEFQEVVTRNMFALGPTAEWRVTTEDGQQVPIGLIVRVDAHENDDDPGEVTSSYFAVAKITPNEVCVTESIPGEASEADVRRAADTARERPCAPPRPPMN